MRKGNASGWHCAFPRVQIHRDSSFSEDLLENVQDVQASALSLAQKRQRNECPWNLTHL